jgi:hypothetical protein
LVVRREGVRLAARHLAFSRIPVSQELKVGLAPQLAPDRSGYRRRSSATSIWRLWSTR